MYASDRHDYLGVIMEFKDQKVEVSMFDYLMGVLVCWDLTMSMKLESGLTDPVKLRHYDMWDIYN